MVALSSMKMNELLISWLGSDVIYENVMRIIEQQKESNNINSNSDSSNALLCADAAAAAAGGGGINNTNSNDDGSSPPGSNTGVEGVGGCNTTNNIGRPPLSPHQLSQQRHPKTIIPPFFRIANNDNVAAGSQSSSSSKAGVNAEGGLEDVAVDNPQNPPPVSPPRRRLHSSFSDDQTWDGIYMINPREEGSSVANSNNTGGLVGLSGAGSRGGGGGGGNGDDGSLTDGNSLITETSVGMASVIGGGSTNNNTNSNNTNNNNFIIGGTGGTKPCIALQARSLFTELGITLGSESSTDEITSILSNYLVRAQSSGSGAVAGCNGNNNNEYHTTIEDCIYIPMERFERITKELCNLPTFFHKPLYARILMLWGKHLQTKTNENEDRLRPQPSTVVTYGIFHYFWVMEMAPYDMNERFFRLLKQPDREYITRDDFFPYIKELLSDHPGLEFLSNHAEFQDKYAVTVITRIFYSVNLCHSGRITSRQIRKSNLLSVFQQVDEEEDINKVTKYFSYEHFYVLYCRFWELDHDRDYKITREDLLKYGEHSLSHMIVDRIFDAAPRPFEGNDAATTTTTIPPTPSIPPTSAITTAVVQEALTTSVPVPPRKMTREYLTYEDFIFFMLSEEDKANEYSVRYWFTCVDVDGDDRLNNMEMRSFYAVQLHRMQCMGHEVVPFEDMLCQMMDMIKPSHLDYLVVEDFLQPHCSQVSGALFDALFNVNKYVMFEQRDPFLERQKREDEFSTDWDRFACIDYNRLAMEEEQREEEAME
jgi:serine/threonine-protein phosphatase 2A regulatory subunit B''